jgi:cellulose synthase/poly-beta-1,6-N-acetylglucosamine synthase-like glycosyltransferase
MRGGEYNAFDIAGPGLPGAGLPSIDLPSANVDAVEAEAGFLRRLGFGKPLVALLADRAARNATTLETELLADGRIDESGYFGALARVLDLPFIDRIDPATIADRDSLDTQLLQPRMLRCHLPDRAPALAIVPSAQEILRETACIRSMPGLRQRIAVTTPSAIRAAVWAAGSGRRVDAAANRLFDTCPDLSARIVFSGSQGFLAGLVLAIFGTMLLALPGITIFVVHILLSSAFFLSLLFRGLAIHFGPWLTRPEPLEASGDALPVYTVLVALYQESAVAAQLVDRLGRLNWPRSRLDIKLICEERDLETIEALRALQLGPEFEIVRVPDLHPRTKPKALNYGLVAARGDYLVIYDAEDRPHADQLLEAYQHFQRVPRQVACLQAPLIVSNAREGWLPALFALEYAGLFRRILPLLGSMHLPMPLGGTSNHFRTDILRDVGGWDSYNVTEDADLGYRLNRLGYRAEMITRPTLEDAPVEIRVWTGQRVRWFKGWMQTWLVLMRAPRRMSAELGILGTITFHAMISGMLLSALGHPLIVAFLAVSVWHLVSAVYVTPLEQALFVTDGVNTVGAYLLFTLMGTKAMTRDERRRVGRKWIFVPLYWLMITGAAWRAVIELHTNPFLWRKTPHKPTGSAGLKPETP